MKFREVMYLVQGHSATKCQRQNSTHRTKIDSSVFSCVFERKKEKEKKETLERWFILRFLSKGKKKKDLDNEEA